MTLSVSGTRSITRADVGKVLACFAADYDAMRESTGLDRDDSLADHLVGDVLGFAAAGYMSRISVLLRDGSGRELRACDYTPSTDAGMWRSDRPGGCYWPRTPGGSLNVTIVTNAAWVDLEAAGQATFRSNLHLAWPVRSTDLSHNGLPRGSDRQFSSNGYGLQRSSFG
jgi:hypothetical protein